jgi:hypothetical protein
MKSSVNFIPHVVIGTFLILVIWYTASTIFRDKNRLTISDGTIDEVLAESLEAQEYGWNIERPLYVGWLGGFNIDLVYEQDPVKRAKLKDDIEHFREAQLYGLYYKELRKRAQKEMLDKMTLDYMKERAK